MWCHPKQIIVNVSHILPCHNGIMATSKDDMMCVSLEEVFIQKRRQRSWLLFEGTEFMQFLAELAILHQDDLKNRMNSYFSPYRPGQGCRSALIFCESGSHCCGAATFFGRLRLRKSEAPEPTPGRGLRLRPNWVGSGFWQKRRLWLHTLKFVIMNS